jgi:hypothetical protein
MTMENQIVKIEHSLMKFTGGLFDGQKVRISYKYVSVFDVIKIAGGQKNPKETWKNLLKKYELIDFCDNLKFKGPGQRYTPCINVDGLVKLLMLIPGKKAIEFKNLTASVMVRYLGGDLTLANEVKNIDNIHIQNGNNDIFRQQIQRKIKYVDKVISTETVLSKKQLDDYNLNNKEIVIKELNTEQINQSLVDDLKYERIRLNKLLELVNESCPEILEIYNDETKDLEKHKKNWAKHSLLQYSLDGKFIRRI